MAGGKLSPRQKMINLMYLVFIAMLAMNMSKQVLSAFGFMNEKLTDANATSETRNDATYASLATKAADQPDKYKVHNQKAQQVQALSIDFTNHIEKMKSTLLEDIEDPTNYESMDSEDKGNTYFFKGDNVTPEGQAFIDKINNYRTKVAELLGEDYKDIVTNVNKRFDTSDQKIEDGTQPWINNRYEGFPLISTITNLSQMQADVKATENEMLTSMVQGQLESDVSMTHYTTILV
ncbi:MAG: gliding motility protein GldM, partial [Flavobacteriaceae bacterium]|nr:gliding motility protein GldM [Flavobacteriaceae bacterium]